MTIRPKQCRFCGKPLEDGSVRCTECGSDQLPFYSPNWRVLLAIASVAVLPLVAVEFQRRQTLAANEERALKDATAELAELSRVGGDLVASAVALSEPCLLESSKDEETCSRELLARLVAFDRSVVAFSWRMQESINRPKTYSFWQHFPDGFWDGWRWRIRYAVFGLNGMGVSGGLVNCLKAQDVACQAAKRAVDVELEKMTQKLKEVLCFLLVDAKQTRLYVAAAISPTSIDELYEGLQHSGKFCDAIVEPLQKPISAPFARIEKWLLGSASIRKSTAPSPTRTPPGNQAQ